MIQQFDDRNKDIKVWINGDLLHRNEAKISVFDSVVQGGDSVWEGIRVYDGRIFCLDKHLKRLMESAKSMDFQKVSSINEIKNAIFSRSLKTQNLRKNRTFLDRNAIRIEICSAPLRSPPPPRSSNVKCQGRPRPRGSI